VLDLFHLVDRDPDDHRTREQTLAGLLSELPSSTLVVPRAAGTPAGSS
jgi:hypothetical protein